MITIKEFFSDDDRRRAAVTLDSRTDTVEVFCYEDNKCVHHADMAGHTVEYAEDTAENFVMYVGAFSK